MSLKGIDFRSVDEADPSAFLPFDLGSDNVCGVKPSESDSEAGSDSDGEPADEDDPRGRPHYTPVALIGVSLAFLHVTAPIASASSELSSPAHPWIGLAFLAALVLALRLSAFVRDLDFDRALMALITKAMREADISHKEAHLLMGYTPGQWSEIVSCQRPAPSLSRMAFLPKAFWKAFIWDFSSLVIAHKVTALADERRAS